MPATWERSAAICGSPGSRAASAARRASRQMGSALARSPESSRCCAICAAANQGLAEGETDGAAVQTAERRSHNPRGCHQSGIDNWYLLGRVLC